MFYYYAFIFFLFGLIIGSFLNVCIYRIPMKQTIVTVPSHCMSCNHQLAWCDLIPLFSWLFLGGKCRYCNAKISAQYPIIEFLNGAIYLAIYLYFGIGSLTQTLSVILFCAFASALLTLSVIDIYHQEIPDGINLFIIVIAVIFTIIDRQNWLSHIIGFFAISVPLLIIALILPNGMGMGDVKLYASCGLFIGWELTVLSLVLASILASIGGIALIVIKKVKKGFKSHIPFGPFIALSILICMFFGDFIIDWYLGFF